MRGEGGYVGRGAAFFKREAGFGQEELNWRELDWRSDLLGFFGLGGTFGGIVGIAGRIRFVRLIEFVGWDFGL